MAPDVCEATVATRSNICCYVESVLHEQKLPSSCDFKYAVDQVSLDQDGLASGTLKQA